MLKELLLWEVVVRVRASKSFFFLVRASIKKSLARDGLIVLEAASKICSIPYTPLLWRGLSWIREIAALSPLPIWIQQKQSFT